MKQNYSGRVCRFNSRRGMYQIGELLINSFPTATKMVWVKGFSDRLELGEKIEFEAECIESDNRQGFKLIPLSLKRLDAKISRQTQTYYEVDFGEGKTKVFIDRREAIATMIDHHGFLKVS